MVTTVDTFHVLAQGQLPSSIAAIYTVPALTHAIIKGIKLVNSTGTDETATLAVNGSGTANQILPPATILAGGWAEDDTTITLGPGETLWGVAGAASAITYTVFGDEVT